MKKTMLALMGTVGLAFGAKAELPTTTGFETGYDLGPLNLTQKYEWSAATTNGLEATDLACVVTNYADAASKPTYLPDAFADAGDKYLAVDTSGSVLYRNVNDRTTDTTTAFGEAESIGKGLYFDADVQFTATDSTGTPEPTAGDKLIVWLSGDDEGNTNLIVTASTGYTASASDGAANYTNSNTNISVKDNEWHRLTVAAATEGTVTTFKVYVDGEQVTADGVTDGKFLSLVGSEDDSEAYNTLTAVGFQGTGAVDNLVWTTDDPFPVVETTFPMTLTVEDEDAATDTALYVQDAAVTNEFTSGVAVGVLKETKTITIVVGVFDGYEVTDFTKGDSYENNDGDPCTYYTKDIAVTSEMLAGGYALTLTVVADGGEEPTPSEDEKEIAPGGKGSIADETGDTYTKEAVEAMVTVVAPNADSLSEKAKADFDNYFTKDASYNSTTKKWEVTVTLDKDTLEADVDDAVEAALEAVVGDAETKAVAIPAGFYYQIEYGTTVDLASKPMTGTSTGSVTMPELGENAGFFKVSVDTTSFEAGE